MPFKSRLIQAIRDEEAKLRTEQTIHITGPGFVLVAFVAIAGWFAVRVLHAPELFGGAFDVIGYGFLGLVIAGSIGRGYTLEKWLARWVQLRTEHQERVARIEAVMARLEKEGLEEAELAVAPAPGEPQPPAPPGDDPWLRALATPKKDAAAEKES